MAQQLEAYKRMPDSVLFRVQRVRVNLSKFDMPVPTRSKVICCRCGQMIRDRREVVQDGQVLCKPCTDDSYFTVAQEITWPDMNWTPAQRKPQLPEQYRIEKHLKQALEQK